MRLTCLERLLLAAAVFEIPLQGAVGGLNISITTICLVLLYLKWMIDLATRPKETERPSIVGIPAVLYLATVALSIVAAPVPALAMFDLALLAQAFMLYFFLANRLRHREDQQFVVFVLALAVIVQSAIVIGLKLFGGAIIGSEVSLGPLTLVVWEDGRPGGTMHSPVLTGSFLALLIVPIVSQLVVPKESRWQSRIVLLLAALLGVLAITLTQTRGAILTVLMAGLVFGLPMLARGWLPKWTPVALLLATLITAVPLLQVLEQRVEADDDGSAAARLHLSAIAWKIIQERPFAGVGAGNCHIAADQVANRGRYRSEWFYTVHCKYLLVWVETGVFGLLAFLAFLGDTIGRGWTAWMSRDRSLAPLGLALSAAVIGHMVHMSVDVFNSRPQVQILWCCAGIAAAVGRAAATARVTVPERRSTRVLPQLQTVRSG